MKRVRRTQREEVKREVGEAGSASPDDRDERDAGRGIDEDRSAARARGGRSRTIEPTGPSEAKGGLDAQG